MSPDAFLAEVERAVNELPPDVLSALDNVAFCAEPGTDDGPLGEYFGTPRVDRIGDPTGMLPDKIAIYQRAIENECGDDPEAIREEIRRTLWHEIGHHLGWDDDALEHEEISRGWRTPETGDPIVDGR